MWLEVVPQLIARIHTQTTQINTLLHRLLTRIGKAHPQALIYALSVPSASHIDSRRLAAQAVLSELRQQCGELVDQAAIVSSELIRVAILWHELWHGGLEEASRLYFGENNIEGLLETLYVFGALAVAVVPAQQANQLHQHAAFVANLDLQIPVA